MKILQSTVRCHLGDCTPTWLNNNAVLNRVDEGTTGFFRNVLSMEIAGVVLKRQIGAEFHGIIKNGAVVTTAKKQ